MEYYNCIDSEPIYNISLLKKIKEYNLEMYFKYNSSVVTADYVGFIFKDDFVISIYPKHFIKKDKFRYEGKLEEEFELMSDLMVDLHVNGGIDSKIDQIVNFPLVAYNNICKYYLLYGLYFEQDFRSRKSYSGRINWKKTIEKSNKVISNKNLVYLPFIVEKNKNKEVLLTHCMRFILTNGYKLFGKYFNIGVPYYTYENNNKFHDFLYVIQELKIIKQKYFKDTEKKLIDDMITYFKWLNSESNVGLLLTNNFNLYWEKMVEYFLNSNFAGIIRTSNELDLYKLKFSKDIFKYKFNKIIEKVETDEVYNKEYTRQFKVEYDHICISKDCIFIFDSKYYKNINSFDYKQLVYNLILQENKNYIDKKIVNGLILPTSGDYNYNVHLDLRDRTGPLKDVLIMEHYLNLKEVTLSYLRR